MQTCVLKSLGVVLVLLSVSARAGEAEEREGLAKLLPVFESSWNKGDVSKFMALFHADCRMKKAYDSDEQTRKKVGQAFKELFKEFGEAKGSEIRKYIARKGRFVVRVTYARKGMVAGTFAVKTDKSGRWRIADFNIDGQGEPELKE